jgi:hypothetical protein
MESTAGRWVGGQAWRKSGLNRRISLDLSNLRPAGRAEHPNQATIGRKAPVSAVEPGKSVCPRFFVVKQRSSDLAET